MRKEINYNSKSKLVNFTVKKINSNEEKTSTNDFVHKNNFLAQSKSFRLRPQDFENLKKINKAINSSEFIKKTYNDSEILRGIINMISAKIDIKKLIGFIKDSS